MFVWIASGYALTVTALYLWGYWGRFGVNFLEYIGFGDMLRYALIPFLTSMAVGTLGFAISVIGPVGDLYPPGGGTDTAFGRFGRKHWRQLAALDLALVFALAKFGPALGRWYVIATLLTLLSLPLTHLDSFIALMPNPQVRASLLSLAIFIAATAFPLGRIKAHNLLSGEGPLFVDVVGSGLQLQFNKDHPVIYVGHLAEFFVLYESASSHLVLLNAEKVSNLILVQNPKAPP